MPSIATANLKTVAVRVPRNKTIRKILKSLNFPLAIPSANKSTQVSPVSAEDVVMNLVLLKIYFKWWKLYNWT